MVPENLWNLVVIGRIQILGSDAFVYWLVMQADTGTGRILLTGGNKDDAAGFKHLLQFS